MSRVSTSPSAEPPGELCEFIIREGALGREALTLRCAALAVEGSRYCPAHEALAAGAKPVKKPRRVHDLDLDVLPWGARDWAGVPLGKRSR